MRILPDCSELNALRLNPYSTGRYSMREYENFYNCIIGFVLILILLEDTL